MYSDSNIQDNPIKNNEIPVWEKVIEDFSEVYEGRNKKFILDEMKSRDEFGRKKYGTPLQCYNGRPVLTDLIQELEDAIVYTKQAILEKKDSKDMKLQSLYMDLMFGLVDVISIVKN